MEERMPFFLHAMAESANVNHEACCQHSLALALELLARSAHEALWQHGEHKEYGQYTPG